MNTFFRYFLVLYTLGVSWGPANGQFQPAEVRISGEKVVIQGRYYYIHTVQKSQTFFSICKAYGVSQELVARENPGLDPAALHEGQAIRIPDYSKVAVSPAESGQEEDKRFYYHTVKPGQTVYFLSRKYDVPEEWIYQFNPQAHEAISAGQVLLIPRKKDFEAVRAIGDTSKYWFYRIREKDTLYALSREYGVSVAQIISENPELEQGLKAGTFIRIPRISADTLLQVADTIPDGTAEIDCNEEFSDKREWKVALLLPFFASLQLDEAPELAAANPETLPDNTLRRQQDLTGKSFVEFYEGFLLALDTLKSRGLNIKLFVYDTERDTLKTKKIIRELYSIQPDLVIGPAYSDDVRLAGQFARNQGINLVSPLSTRTELIAENPNIIQVVPSEDTENTFFARHISRYKANPIILFRSDDSLSMRESWKFKKELLSWLDTDSAGNPINFRDYKLNDTTIRKLSKLLQADADNIILVFSRNEPDVTELIGKLHLLSRIYRITLFGMPAWQVWKSIDINYFHTMQMQYYSPFYIDYHDPEVIRFIKKCRTIYGFEPYEITPKGYNFCMMGYDIGLFFISALEKYGNDFAQCMNQIEVSQLLSRYRFSKTGAGYSNQSVTMIRYNTDYTLESVNDSPEGPAGSEP